MPHTMRPANIAAKTILLIFRFIVTSSISFYIFNFSEKSAMASETLICCGQTASQLLQPIQALGSLSFGYEDRAIGAINPPLVKQCSL